jgi:hypothetical protein
MSAPQTQTSFLAFLGRLMWVMVGPLVLAIATLLIATRGGGWLTGLDVAYLAVLAGMFLGRWLEFQGGSPQTAEGQPATAADLRNYVVFGVVIGLGVWAVANVVGNHVLN